MLATNGYINVFVNTAFNVGRIATVIDNKFYRKYFSYQSCTAGENHKYIYRYIQYLWLRLNLLKYVFKTCNVYSFNVIIAGAHYITTF